MGLETQWERISASLPGGWERAELELAVPDEETRSRAAALLGPLAPGRVGNEIRFVVSRGAGIGPDAARRLLANLDHEGISGTLVLLESGVRTAVPGVRRASLTAQWDELVAGLPEDWSDLLCRLDLHSSDDVARAALYAAPLNPSRPAKELGFDFRVARTFGYGTSPQMTRRCLERLDEIEVPGEVGLMRALSDTQPVATQGPVWYVGGKVL